MVGSVSFQRSGEYEKLVKAFQLEKLTTDLQSLPLDFFLSFQELMLNNSWPDHSFESVVQERVHFLLDKLFLLRKAKILRQVLANRSIPTSHLSQVEKRYYLSLSVADQLLTSSPLEPTVPPLEATKGLVDEFVTSLPPSWADYIGMKVGRGSPSLAPEEGVVRSGEVPPRQVEVRVLKSIPQFIGLDREVYGPFSPGQVVTLPESICRHVLLPKRMVEPVE